MPSPPRSRPCSPGPPPYRPEPAATSAIDLGFGLEVPEARQPAAWRGLLTSLYGAVAEEVQLRVFLMGVLAWGLGKLGPELAWPVWLPLLG